MIRIIDGKLVEGQIPSTISSYDIKKNEFKDLFELTRKRFTNYMETLCSYMLNARRRISDTKITSYNIEEYMVAIINNWDLYDKGTIIGHSFRLFEMDKCDISLIPYKSGSSQFSLFVSKGWMTDKAKFIDVMTQLADYCLLDIFSDKIKIGMFDAIWIDKYWYTNLTVYPFIFDYYLNLFRCIISFSSKLNYSDFEENKPDIYNSPFRNKQEAIIWDYAKRIEQGIDIENEYVNAMIEIFNSIVNCTNGCI